MELNRILIWSVGAGCWINLLYLVGQKHALRPAVIAISILITLGICQWFLPESAGYIAASLYLILVLVPFWVGCLMQLAQARKQYRLASVLARILAVVHPAPETRSLLRLFQALHLHRIGETRQASDLLKTILISNPNGIAAFILRTRFQGDWQEILDFCNAPANVHFLTEDPTLCDTYLQALGETGQRVELIRQYELLLPAMRKKFSNELQFIRAKIAAFSGEESTAAQWLSGPLRELPLDLKRYWRATAVQVSGRTEEARKDFEWLVQNSDVGIAVSAQRRLNSPLKSVLEEPLEESQAAVLREISEAAEVEVQHGVVQLSRTAPCWATWSVAASLIVVFLFEIPGGSEDLDNLKRMGAMLIPVDPAANDAWRMFAAAFLHFGPIHLLMNLLGLVLLGRQIERSWGTPLTLLTYLLSAFGSVGLAPYLIQLGGDQDFVMLVGASGGVMGLFGGLLVQALFTFFRTRTLPAFRDFLVLLTVLLIQMTFDANTPAVSAEAHIVGTTIGACCGTIWNVCWWIRDRRKSL